MVIDPKLVERCCRLAHGERWRVAKDRFARALEESARKAFPNQPPAPRDLDRYLTALHLEDLALACACADGDEGAWDHFVLTQRPVLYRAGDALDATGGARELADSLYAELFGISAAGEPRPSLFRYFHGRSTLATWLRAVLAQRYVDRLRAERRTEPLPDEESSSALSAPAQSVEPERARHFSLIREAIKHAVGALPARDRLRLGCYYAQQMTLAQIGKALGEHEGTVSRSLARTRKVIRETVENDLRRSGLSGAEIDECFASVTADAGSLSMQDMLG